MKFWKAIAIAGLLGFAGGALFLFSALNGHATRGIAGGQLTYATDKAAYRQGELVTITVSNVSDVPAAIVDRTHLDGGFATIERRAEDGRWQIIELYAAANVTAFRSLKPGEQYQYIWQTTGYNRADSVAAPGIYRISFGRPVYTNSFEITVK